ncbi:MAG: hypothetical protein U1E27_13435, partial [Kiritimatiellia bacterium]|nr:hypothetical protein [Kiritimatiellia bacterium]
MRRILICGIAALTMGLCGCDSYFAERQEVVLRESESPAVEERLPAETPVAPPEPAADTPWPEAILPAQQPGEPLPGVHLARGKPYTMSSRPNYSHTTDDGDAVQLTDGLFTEGYYWVQKSTVGWEARGQVEILVDLGAVEPIGEIAIRTGAGRSRIGMYFPDAAFFVSEDGKAFHPVGRFLGSGYDREDEWYATRYHVTDLQVRGRYVAVLLMANGRYIFADEIEVLRGEFDEPPPMEGRAYAAGSLYEVLLDARRRERQKTALRREVSEILERIGGDDPLFGDMSALSLAAASADTDEAFDAVRQSVGVLNARLAARRFPGRSRIVHSGYGWNDFSPYTVPEEGVEEVRELSLVM